MLAREYKVDAVIVFSSWGCRRNNAAVPTLKRELNKIGYPLLSLDGDCVDDHNYMPGQFSTRIEGFLRCCAEEKLPLILPSEKYAEWVCNLV